MSLPADIILASTSVYRRTLLERLGLTFRCEAPGVDEAVVQQLLNDPLAIAEQLAFAKASAVAERFPQAIVIGSDQLATIDGEVLGKPGARQKAEEQLARLSGRTHELITAVCILRVADGTRLTHTDRTRLTMRALKHDEISRYVALDRPLDCAGAYKIEAAGIGIFSHVDTEDFTAITGLPLMAVVRMLNELGVSVP